MKLEPNKLRLVLLEIETMEPNEVLTGRTFVSGITKKHGFSEDEAIEYVHILSEGGFVRAKIPEGGNAYVVSIITGLTIDGHDFLNKVRDDRVWNKVLVKLKNIGVGASVEVMKLAANEAVRSLFK